MSKKKHSDKNDTLTKALVLITAILNLIKAVAELFNRWLK